MRIAVFLLCMALWMPRGALAAAVASADQVGGYAGHVLDKVTRRWNPPLDPLERKVRVRLRIDGSGKIIECVSLEPSGLPAMDNSVCAAAKSAAGFGTPPYGLDIDVYMTFWTGKPTPKPAEPETVPTVAPTASPPASPSSARMMVQPTKAEPPTGAEAKKAATSAPAASPPASPGSARMIVQPTKAGPPVGAEAKKAKAPKSAAANVDRRYVNAVMAEISPNVAVPSNLPAGEHAVGVLLRVDAGGQILQAGLARSSGNAELDGAVIRGVKRTGKVGAPPDKRAQEMNLTFVVKKP